MQVTRFFKTTTTIIAWPQRAFCKSDQSLRLPPKKAMQTRKIWVNLGIMRKSAWWSAQSKIGLCQKLPTSSRKFDMASGNWCWALAVIIGLHLISRVLHNQLPDASIPSLQWSTFWKFNFEARLPVAEATVWSAKYLTTQRKLRIMTAEWVLYYLRSQLSNLTRSTAKAITRSIFRGSDCKLVSAKCVENWHLSA